MFDCEKVEECHGQRLVPFFVFWDRVIPDFAVREARAMEEDLENMPLRDVYVYLGRIIYIPL